MTRVTYCLAGLFVGMVCLTALSGCAGTKTDATVSHDPVLIRKEITELDMEILNTEEMYKASLTELQMEESTDLRREVNRLWVELEHLRSQKKALEERLGELEAENP